MLYGWVSCLNCSISLLNSVISLDTGDKLPVPNTSPLESPLMCCEYDSEGKLELLCIAPEAIVMVGIPDVGVSGSLLLSITRCPCVCNAELTSVPVIGEETWVGAVRYVGIISGVGITPLFPLAALFTTSRKCGLSSFSLRRRNHRPKNIIAARNPTPPITPPAMAPVLLVLVATTEDEAEKEEEGHIVLYESSKIKNRNDRIGINCEPGRHDKGWRHTTTKRNLMG